MSAPGAMQDRRNAPGDVAMRTRGTVAVADRSGTYGRAMEARRIGSLDNVSAVGLGCNNFGMRLDAGGTNVVVDAAIEAGITYFDTAESYGEGLSEEFLGAALAGRRQDVLVATKWGHTVSLKNGDRGGDPSVIRRSLDASLTRLGTDYVDHYQLHRPDPETPMDETLGALDELVAEGKIREIGCTAFSAAELEESGAAAARRNVPRYPSVQNHYSLLTRTPETDGVLDVCARDGLVLVPYFPLESGLLTGKYRAGEALPEGSRLARWGNRASAFIDDEKLAAVARLENWAAAHGHTLLDLAMSWLTGNPLVATVIAGATSPEQVQANVHSAAWTLTAAERAEVDAVGAG
jgi:aryl-alcohol dehydrogenase-like predicted oxidoreductase